MTTMIPGPIQPRRVSSKRSNEGCLLCEARDNVWRAAYPYTADGLDGYVEACGAEHAAEQIHDEVEFRRQHAEAEGRPAEAEAEA